ncbi:MAG: ABC transporter ATP-binding protein [Actinomycetota bacterium]
MKTSLDPKLKPEAGNEKIIEVEHVTKTFTGAEDKSLTVLEDISLSVAEDEIVALLGKSGSGKSTLLRCIAGLIAPTKGIVRYREKPLEGANPGVAMVFQTFALLPWLTVLQNVELGLEARGVPPKERRTRAERVIDLIGLDGFESAYPKELSGGMRQRVGFARALVVEPDALLMDEPFSALDVLTAENLRVELLSLWARDDFPTKAMLIVTHNIEEAVLLADRILVLQANPGRINQEIAVTFERPRSRRTVDFQALVDRIYGIMTGHPEPEARPARVSVEKSPIEAPLPFASVGGMAGLLEVLQSTGGKEDLPDLATELNFEVDDLLPLVDALEMLGFAKVQEADIEMTDEGRAFFEADILKSKEIFARQAREKAPLVRAISQGLERTQDGSLDEGLFLDLLRRGFSDEDARRQLDIAIDWGRYGELFEYDADSGQLVRERPAE